MVDIAVFIYEAASLLSRSREAARRHDDGELRAAVVALRAVGEEAGAERMVTLCGALRDRLTKDHPDEVDALITAIGDELEQVTGELQLSRSA